MSRPMDFKDGLGEFMSLYTPESQLYVLIPSVNNPWAIDAMIGHLELEGITLAAERRVNYTPPSGVGHHGYPRTECLQIPAGYGIGRAALVIDDSIEDGGTLDAALKALLAKGFISDDVWFLPISITWERENRKFPFDRAKVFLDYLRSL